MLCLAGTVILLPASALAQSEPGTVVDNGSVSTGTIHGVPQQYMIPPESVSMSVGETRVLEAPFEIERKSASSKAVQIVRVSGHSLTVTGTEAGTADVKVGSSSLEKTFRITVTDSLMATYRALNRDLSDLSEVSVEYGGNSLALRGEITNYSHWEYFLQVMKRYENRCRSYVSFRPGPEMFEALKKQLERAGYKVTDKPSGELPPGTLYFSVSSDILTVGGRVLSAQDVDAVKQIVDSQKWLAHGSDRNGMRAVCRVEVADIQIDVGVVIVGVTRSELDRLGNSSADGTVVSMDLAAWFKSLAGELPDAIGKGAPKRNGTGAFSYINTRLQGAIRFFGDNNISDFRDAGHVTFTNNSAAGGSYQNGGTLNVGIYSSETADLKEIDYGLKIVVKGGLVRGDQVKLDLEIEKSLAPVKQDADYLQRKTKTKTELICPLDKTAVIAGQREFAREDSGPSGYAFLRHVPVVNWFTSFEQDKREELQLLILVSPQIAAHKVNMTSKPSADTARVEDEVSASIREKTDSMHEREKRGWFRRMFTW